MDSQKQESIASKGGLTAQAHRHGYGSAEEYQKAKERGEVEFSKSSGTHGTSGGTDQHEGRKESGTGQQHGAHHGTSHGNQRKNRE